MVVVVVEVMVVEVVVVVVVVVVIKKQAKVWECSVTLREKGHGVWKNECRTMRA